MKMKTGSLVMIVGMAFLAWLLYSEMNRVAEQNGFHVQVRQTGSSR